MSSTPSFPALLQRFFTQRLMQQRRASPHTIGSYRDSFRLLLHFAQARLGKPPTQLAFEQLDAPLIAAFLAVQRLQSGGLVLPTGTLAGWVFLRKLVNRTRLLDGPGDPGVAEWLLPQGDPRQSPVLWGGLLLGIAFYAWRARAGDQPAAAGKSAQRIPPVRVLPDR